MRIMPAVVVTGARQTGKTTLVRELLRSEKRHYRSLDELDTLELARTDPGTLIARQPLTLDEVQRAPEVLRAIKTAIDAKRTNGSFILTGSANLLLMNAVSESLAGRALYLELLPFCPCEFSGAFEDLEPLQALFSPTFSPEEWPDNRGDWQKWLLRGGMPSAALLNGDEERSLWFSGYVQTYLERDLRQLSAVAGLADFQRIMRLAANRTGRLLNQSDIARDAALPQPTCHRYLNLLETGYQIVRLSPYHTNPSQSLVKAKKLLFNDGGIAAYLAGIDGRQALEKRMDLGSWLEQAVFQSVQAWKALDPVGRRISFWRDRRGNEVDFVLEDKNTLVAVEIKNSTRVMPSDFSGINSFRTASGKGSTVRGVILHAGSDRRIAGENCFSLPFGWMFP
ncbi:MAG: ATP-binding protein [Chitinispirillaceae bacterium]|nr:ATP-binding protein [Chitinispirillaceae bacterium]